ncbi:MAG: hypothetical protein HPY90_13000 [Syntrophothermus sp.]|uniref:hypothetical protein n=1 Tax=Syntrophothermus sp. TaxID=2736299 RepID=UPI00257F6516|nr:hypothetical protein [Syntrophothermus sp.]NSW84166.1 hypothetical protein [Syntrophothermus sp.]
MRRRKINYQRIVFNGAHEYSSYPVFFFASDFLNDKDYVRRVLVAAKAKNVDAALTENMSDFGNKYGKFAVYKWNRDPFLVYSDPPNFPAIGASGDSVGEFEIKKPDLDYFNERLRPGAISYWHLKFNPDKKKINKVVFNLMTDIPNPLFHAPGSAENRGNVGSRGLDREQREDFLPGKTGRGS